MNCIVYIDSNFQNVMWPQCYKLCKMSSFTLHRAFGIYFNLWCKMKERIYWLAYHTSLLRKLIECFSLLWKLFMQIYILSYSIHKSAEAWMSICKKEVCGFLRENINFFSRLTILCHHQWDVVWWCVMELCLSILSINVYWIHPIFYTTWSHYHDILVRAYCVCILNEKYAILTYIKSLTTCYLFYTLTIRLAIFTDYIWTCMCL